MNLGAVLQNHVLLTGLAGWLLAQALKIPIDLFQSRHWNWALFFAAGGMPSSHSALIVGVTNAIGLYIGYGSPLFALGVAITMIVTYDAAGIRRQAGMHAERINILFEELLKGHMWDEKELREVLGHTPLEVTGGILWGIVITTVLWLIWK